jgi:S-layer protein
MNMISTGAFLDEMDASNKQGSVSKLVKAWEKKNAKIARAGGVSLMALSLAACGSDDGDTASSDAADPTPTTPVAPVAQNFVGTTGIDTFTGGAGDDTMSASNTTLNAGDSFTGGEGSDLLAIFSSAAATLGGFTATGVETIAASSSGGLVTVNMGNVTGETAMRVTGSSNDVTFTGQASIVDLELQYNSAGDVIVTHNASVVVGTADSMTVKTTDTANTIVNLASIETVNIENSGVSSIATLTTTAATTLNVSGSGTLTLTDIDDASLTVNMANYSGTSTVDGMNATGNVAFTGGSGADTINFDGLTKDDSIAAGDGADTLILTAATNSFLTSTTANDITVTGVETLSLVGNAAGDAIDFDGFSAPNSFTKVLVTSTLDAGNITLTDIQTTNIEVRNTNNGTTSDNINAITVDLKDSTGAADTVDLALTNRDVNETMTVATVTAAGVETLNITADAAVLTGAPGDIAVTTLTATSAKTVTLTGDADTTLGAFATTVTSFSAAGATGDMAVTFAGANVTATGGAGADTFSFGASFTDDDTVDGGAGTDTLALTGANGSTNVEATSIETLTVTGSGNTGHTNTLDVDDLTTLATLNTIFTASAENIVVNNMAANVTTVVDQGATTTVTAALTLDLDKDTTADAGTIHIDQDGTGFTGDITANDYETLTIQLDYTTAATVSAGDVENLNDITATDATSIVIDTINVDSYDTAADQHMLLGSIDASAAYTLDLRGIDMNIGTLDNLTAVTADATAAAIATGNLTNTYSADLAIDQEVGISFTAADAVTILLDDDRQQLTSKKQLLT